MITRAALIFVLIAVVPCFGGEADMTLLSVERIWDKAPHNAFTDLVRFDGRLVCAFREAKVHEIKDSDSRIRIIVSNDAKGWEFVGELTDNRGDIRDAKLTILPDGRLMVLTATAILDQSSNVTYQSVAFFTRDLKTWEGPVDVGEPNVWLWGINFHGPTGPAELNGVGYSFGYGTADKRYVQLFKTKDGVKFERVGDPLKVDAAYPSEGAIYFDADDTMQLLLRCDPWGDDKTAHAYIGAARPPYTDWTLKRLKFRIEGPSLTRAPGGRLLGAVPLLEPQPHLGLFWIDPETGEFTECLSLPSAIELSSPGLVWDGDMLNMSYHSMHEEGKARIYFSRVKFNGAAAFPVVSASH